jgi:hypothetical protein
LSGVDIFFGNQYDKDETTASLDRKDSGKGYTLDNVQWVHKRVNIMKNIISDMEFIEWCKKVANHRGV